LEKITTNKRKNMNQVLKKSMVGVLKVAGTFVVTAAGTYLGNIAWEATREPICNFLDSALPWKKKENKVLPEEEKS
jgi:hypothetical protein